VADLLRVGAMTSLTRRALLRFPRSSQTLYRAPNFPRQRLFITSYIPRQAIEDNARPEEIESLNDAPIFLEDDATQVDWSRSFHGLSTQPFSEEAAKVLTAPLEINDVEIKPGPRSTLPRLMVDGILYLPEIKYRRILNRAFGPGGWGLAPRSETTITAKSVSREYALVCHGRLVSVARGEQDYFDPGGVPTATEGCKSNALMRCCKDLGIASELW
jgi:hypothetical protein